MGPYRGRGWKLYSHWLGPYRVRKLDGTSLKESVAGNCLKKFFSREGFEGDVDEELEVSGGVTLIRLIPASFWPIRSEKAGKDAERRAGDNGSGLFDG